jgi:hypothetical protein
MEMLGKILRWQRQTLDPRKIFGKMDPRVVKNHFKQDQIFKKGLKEESYIEEKNDMSQFLFKPQNRRGSSENWNDEMEFVTPNVAKKGAEGNPFEHIKPFVI